MERPAQSLRALDQRVVVWDRIKQLARGFEITDRECRAPSRAARSAQDLQA